MTPRKKTEASAGPASKPSRSMKSSELEEAADPAPAPETLAVAPGAPGSVELPDIDRMVVFHMAEQRYSIPIDAVQEIQQIVAFADVPSGQDAVIGMINLRGSVIPAFDMRLLLGLPAQDFHVDTPMIICKTEGQLVALVVDEVEDVVLLPEGCMSPPPRMHSLSSRMIGVCRMGMDLVYLLDIDKLMSPLSLPQGQGV